MGERAITSSTGALVNAELDLSGRRERVLRLVAIDELTDNMAAAGRFSRPTSGSVN